MLLALLTLPVPLLLSSAPIQDPVAAEPGAQEEPQALGRSEVEITYLANEGFLLRSGRFKVLIDAFVAEPYSGYEALPPDTLKKLVNAHPPFDGNAIMALVSHMHLDHFQPQVAEMFLRASPAGAFISSPQVVNTLARGAEDFAKIKKIVGAMPLKPGQSQRLARAEVTLEFMNLRHGGEEHAKIQNYGHLITMSGLKILHVGDAEPDEELFAPFDLASEEIDIAFVPYWYWMTEEGVRIIDEQFHANFLIACHFPLSEKRGLVERLTKDNPHVLVFDKSGDKKVFRAENPVEKSEDG